MTGSEQSLHPLVHPLVLECQYAAPVRAEQAAEALIPHLLAQLWHQQAFAAQQIADFVAQSVRTGSTAAPAFQVLQVFKELRENPAERERAASTVSLCPLCVYPFPPAAGTMGRQT